MGFEEDPFNFWFLFIFVIVGVASCIIGWVGGIIAGFTTLILGIIIVALYWKKYLSSGEKDNS